MDYSQLHKIAKFNNKKFPFKEVIKNIENCEVLPFENLKLLTLLKTVCQNTIEPVNNIEFTGRPNEFGNIVANLFGVECKKLGLDYQKPKIQKVRVRKMAIPMAF